MGCSRLVTVGVLAATWFVAGCADTTTNVRTRAAQDLACTAAQTQVVEGKGGVYRIQGCGFEASYVCHEDGRSLDTRCEQIYVSKLTAGPEKDGTSSALAKEQR